MKVTATGRENLPGGCNAGGQKIAGIIQFLHFLFSSPKISVVVVYVR
jgi:hypothetical protein